jgi:hypothetical protein
MRELFAVVLVAAFALATSTAMACPGMTTAGLPKPVVASADGTSTPVIIPGTPKTGG